MIDANTPPSARPVWTQHLPLVWTVAIVLIGVSYQTGQITSRSDAGLTAVTQAVADLSMRVIALRADLEAAQGRNVALEVAQGRTAALLEAERREREADIRRHETAMERTVRAVESTRADVAMLRAESLRGKQQHNDVIVDDGQNDLLEVDAGPAVLGTITPVPAVIAAQPIAGG